MGKCNTCKGTGKMECGGSGSIGFGTVKCPRCNGKGMVECTKCSGTGKR